MVIDTPAHVLVFIFYYLSLFFGFFNTIKSRATWEDRLFQTFVICLRDLAPVQRRYTSRRDNGHHFLQTHTNISLFRYILHRISTDSSLKCSSFMLCERKDLVLQYTGLSAG